MNSKHYPSFEGITPPKDGFLAANYTTESSISSYILSLQWQFATLGDNFVHPWLEGLPSLHM